MAVFQESSRSIWFKIATIGVDRRGQVWDQKNKVEWLHIGRNELKRKGGLRLLVRLIFCYFDLGQLSIIHAWRQNWVLRFVGGKILPIVLSPICNCGYLKFFHYGDLFLSFQKCVVPQKSQIIIHITPDRINTINPLFLILQRSTPQEKKANIIYPSGDYWASYLCSILVLT